MTKTEMGDATKKITDNHFLELLMKHISESNFGIHSFLYYQSNHV